VGTARTPLALVSPEAAGRMAIGEALTNIAAAPISDIGDIKLSANWMAAAGRPGEDARLYDAVRAATRAFVEFLRPIPSVALIVLVALILGPGLQMNVLLIVYAAVWPVLLNTIYGLDDVDPVARETLRAFGFGRLGVIFLVDLPSAAPFIATGIRLASSIAIILDISTGYLTGRISGNGIGAYIAQVYTGAGNTSLVLAAALWAGLLGLAANAFLVWGERRVLRWHHSYSLEPA